MAVASSLALNQIPTQKSKKSPYELFKGVKLPLSYFHPLGSPVSYLILPKPPGSKLLPPGDIGHLIGYNPEIQSYQILSSTGKITVKPKHNLPSRPFLKIMRTLPYRTSSRNLLNLLFPTTPPAKTVLTALNLLAKTLAKAILILVSCKTELCR